MDWRRGDPESLPLVLGDPRWRQRVEPLGLEEPSPRQMRAILEATVARLAPDVEGAPDDCVRRELGRALEQAQLQAARFLPEMAQPGASLRLVERALASGELTSLSVQQALCEVSGLPEAIVRDDLPMIYADVAQRLADRVIGQPEAIDAAANALLMVKAGLTNPRRPLAVLGFFGRSGGSARPTRQGTGRELIGDDGALVRIDMSEVRRSERGGAVRQCRRA
ncbi:hypothetical protein [Candidatus Amarobacter glycogenicus]|uniref:hypothetical protein n=1 Tax=Candidatus Amarobacter glycogenicus TaxID=3140699 RepID=UPI002A1155BC|nr:hypothetical protein [Dehalococcoidia bacterium]